MSREREARKRSASIGDQIAPTFQVVTSTLLLGNSSLERL